MSSPEAILAQRALARRNFRDFVPFVRMGYDMRWFHKVIANELQKVYERQTRRLMIFVPPQHGKSELSTRSFPGWVLGKNPNEKIVIASYSATVASKFNRDIKRRIESGPFSKLFPDTRLSDGRDGFTKNNEEFEIKHKEGSVYTVGVGGSLTSRPVDIGIIDDPIKDRQDAQSMTVRESTWDWYTDVFETRLHNASVQIIIQTRWHQDDLSGRLLERDGIYSEINPNGWRVVSFPALRTEDINDFDPRPLGQALWPERHSQAKIEKVKHDSPITFNALYQQDPKPSPDALVFPDWHICDEMPANCEVYFNGQDFGYTNDPTAWVRIGRMGKRLYLDELIYQPGLTNPEIAQRMKLSPASRYETYADSAEPKSIAELQRLGLRIIPTVKGPDSINAGINKLHEFDVYVTKRSTNLIKEKNNYEWIMIGGTASNVPIDAFNHAIDAVRGAVYTKYAIPGPMKLKNRSR